MSETPANPEPVVRTKWQKIGGWIILLLLFQFFGCGLLVFINLFKPILPGDSFPIIGLVLFAEMAVLWVAGMSIKVISAMRGLAGRANRNKP
ncbi:MAG TPA: hypothetical protein VGG30_08355 [Pirellulales bacterium]|jgi:hypothetical protein